MSNSKKILDSFSIKDTLNPKVWENYETPKKALLKSKIREALMKISEEFVDDLGDDIFVDDIYLMGSLANFNWSEFSDFDLHVIIDFERYGDKEELYKELFDLKKKIFNTKHNIKIYGYDVELYAQGSSDKAHSDGVYSVLNNEWIHVPTKTKMEINMSVLKDKIKCWTDKIDDAIEDSKKTKKVENLKKLKEKLKEYRQSGLSKDGEFSYENLVFKYLRRSGHIGKLFDEKTKIKDKELSIERKLEEGLIGSLRKFLEEQSSNDDIDVTETESKFLNYLDELKDNGVKFEFTPGQKIPYESDVEKIQTGLQFLGYSLPKWGVDGKFGPETELATMNFQADNGQIQNGVFGPIEIELMISRLIEKNFKDEDLISIQKEREVPYDIFTYLNLNNSEEFEIYKKICQKFIDYRNSDAQVTGEMMANCARRYFGQGYVPPELALSQLTLEGGLSKKADAKPIRTKNPFNVGNTDSGEVNIRDSFEDGVCLYYDLMTRRYLTQDKKAEDLLQNFVNINGHRYATGVNYEDKLISLVSTIKNVTQP